MIVETRLRTTEATPPTLVAEAGSAGQNTHVCPAQQTLRLKPARRLLTTCTKQGKGVKLHSFRVKHARMYVCAMYALSDKTTERHLMFVIVNKVGPLRSEANILQNIKTEAANIINARLKIHRSVAAQARLTICVFGP